MISAGTTTTTTTTTRASLRGTVGRSNIGRLRKTGGKRMIVVSSSSGAENPFVMDQERANKVLGLSGEVSSDLLVKAHKEMLEKYEDDDVKRAEVEAAYDVLLMKSFKRRTTGETADNKVKYADVVPTADKIRAALPSWARQAGASLPAGPQFSAPPSETLTRAGALFGALALVTLVQGVSLPEGVDSAPGLEIALALGATVWFMNQKRVRMGRAVAIAFGALVLGSVVGGAVQGWLRVDLVPLAGISSPSTIVSEFGILSLFVAAAFLD